ncbi:T9SS type A sorting domain-containing protein [Flavobacterium sp. MAH-1]|uniref:T9SS type A sorting domain-containing protein n=1 Tax=Flavobacterium agri TaxID=2743471 RepID=A0A7Y8Y1G8_9FLAO|nr:T9SS type A sorting domain-containing protein [Flavobacterium agri]NUY80633.1 T9SS type A sorting domain-containing protein [Flavobacterium agri]NYA70657.1 T9SS type A sorting domain-containing protein [Flavobacterium agri]
MKKITLATLALCSFAVSQAQTGRTVFGSPVRSVNPATGQIRCVSDEYEASLQQKNSNRANTEAFETWIAAKVEAAKQRLMNSKSVAEVVHIPVVVHVIHNGDAVGTNENISDARVISQITVLNNDFRRILGTPGYNTNAVGADVEVEFCLAQKKPDGSATNGIDRVNLNTAQWSTEASIENNLKPNTIWDPTQYFNIWVCQFSSSPSAEMYGILGYAQFPSNSGLGGLNADGGLATTDGVIIDWHCFGSSDYSTGNYYSGYDKGRTATHEIGHCFGLRHIWGDSSSCTVNATDSFKDFCPDTPAAAEENYDCDAVYNSCALSPGNDMVENYMDYTYDTCMNIFTLNQKARILAVLQNSPRRSTLPASTACQALATPDFDKFEGLNLYPNPADSFVTIGISGDLPQSYEVVNALGQMVAVRNISNDSDLTISTASFANGVYFVKVTKEGATKTLRFIKQ